METVTQNAYNPHALITLRYIVPENGDNVYNMYKATELEGILDNPELDVLEHMPNGTIVTHKMKRTDVSELFRKRQFDVATIERLESQVNRIKSNLTANGWYNPNTDLADVLQELCDILQHEPKQTVFLNANVSVQVSYEIPLADVEDFDARYFLQDNLTIDSWHGDVMIESFDVEDADIDWNE